MFIVLKYRNTFHHQFVRSFHAIYMFHDYKRRTDVFCHGELLKTVQSARIFKDSKTFVDMKMKLHPTQLLFNFDRFMRHHAHKPSKARIKRFIFQHFHNIESEFEPWMPRDYKEEPKMIKGIKDEDLRNWAYELNQMWPMLGKKIKQDCKLNEELYSIIYLKNPMVVPGSRFRAFFYWDSYWIILGLLHCEMLETVKQMLDNFIYLIDYLGHVPHGNRIYLMNRSQPPLFIPMLRAYYEATKNLEYIRENVAIAEKELAYWLSNHTVEVEKEGQRFTLAIYGDESSGPRPEHYHDDITMADWFDEDSKEDFYSEIKAAVESGWNFSSRWVMDPNKGNRGEIQQTKTKSIVPVDLNAILYGNMVTISELYKLLENEEKSDEYRVMARHWMRAVTAVLWNDDKGCWFDFDLENQYSRDYFYPSNFTPLWTGCFRKIHKAEMVDKIVKYIKSENVILTGGVPASFVDSGQKWDFPFVWSPLQYILVEGLSNTENKEAQRIAFAIAQRYVRNAFLSFEHYGYMYQRYYAQGGPALPSGGFDAQIGYGWSNGVGLHFLQKYGDRLTLVDFSKPVITSSSSYLEFSQNDANVFLAE